MTILREIVCITLLIVGLKTSRVLYGTFASPLGLFTMSWEGSLALANLRLVEYVDTSAQAEFMLQASYMLVLLSAVLVGPTRQAPVDGERAATWLGRTLLILGTIGVSLGFWQLSKSLGILAVISDPVRVRVGGETRLFDPGVIGDLIALMLPAAFFLRPASLEGYLLVAIAAAWSLLSGQRLFVAEVTLFLLVGSVYQRGARTHPPQMLPHAVLAGISLLVFVVGASILGKDQQLAIQVERGTHSQGVIPATLMGPYVYATGPFIAFGRYVEEEPPAEKGIVAVITPLNRLAGQQEETLYEFRPIPFAINVYTYLRSWYDAFGMIGTLIGPVIYGLIASAAYCRRRLSIGWCFLAVTMTVGMVGGVFAPFLTHTDFLALAAVSVVLPLLLPARRKVSRVSRSSVPMSHRGG